MTKELQKILNHENEDWFIVFSDGSNLRVTYHQAQQVLKLSGYPNRTGVKINGAYYKFYTIAKIIPSSEFYQQYPEKREEYPNYTYPDPYNLPQDQLLRITSPIKLKQRRLSALKKMRKGILKHINSPNYQGTQAPQKLLAKVEAKIAQLSQ